MAPRPGTTDLLANYLVNGYWRDNGGAPHHWDTPNNLITVDLAGLTAAGRALARAALDAWEMVANVEFRETSGGAHITFDDEEAGADADVDYYPGSGDMISAFVNVGTDRLSSHGTAVGGRAFQTYMHEIGHALGLGHGGHYDGAATYANATWTNDSWQQTVMSYLDQDENTHPSLHHVDRAYVVTPMMADIVAIQSIYGAPTAGSPTHGNTIWGAGSNLPNPIRGVFGPGPGDLGQNAMTIYDAGGLDALNLSNGGAAQVINLTPGAFSSAYGQVGNIGIARNTTIERAYGGSGGDSITGNAAANLLGGNGGADRIHGGDGADLLYGGGGNDRLHGGSGDNRMWGEAGHDRLEGGNQDDILAGGDGNDVLIGGGGADRLDGGRGDDRLGGGSGRDTFVFARGADLVADFQDNVDTLMLNDALWGGLARTVAQVLEEFARIEGGDVVFRFGDGNTLRVDGVSSVSLLANDIVIA